MKDLRWPVWDQGTYYCFWYVNFFPESYCTFYGGLATKGADTPPGMFMSYWGNITNIHEGEFFYRHGYGAEGSKGGANGSVLFMQPNSWYRMVLRIFPPAKGADKHTLVGWWVKDVAKNEWHTHSVVRIDTRATGVRGNSGFVEALAPESVHRAFERRLGYCRVDGKWFKSNTITTGSPQFFKLIDNGTVLRYDKSVPDSPGQQKIELAAKQPDVPTLDRPAIDGATARAYGNQVAVQWGVPKNASPQLGYRIEVFDNASAKGAPMATFDDVAPHVLARRLDVDRTARSVRLGVTDIFDQTTSVTIPVAQATPAEAESVAKHRGGLKYTYYEAPSGVAWEQLPDFSALQPAKQGVVKITDDTIREERDKLYATEYKGFIKVPRTGLYVVELGTCDGSRLRIDGRVVADRDGIHGTSVRQYPMALAQGLHAFELSYFKGAKPYLADKILLAWEGPGFETRKLTPADFVCEDNFDTPSITMPAADTVAKGVANDNLVSIRPAIQSRGHRIAKVQFYRDRLLLETAVNTASSGVGELAFHNLLPAGDNRLWARLWYDDGCSVDSNVISVKAENKTEGVWSYDTLGENMFPLAVRSYKGTISFRGDGFCFGNQPVSGDFTLTARVADMGVASEENGIHKANWLGLYVQQDLTRPFSGHRFGIYCTAGGSVKGSADFPDLAGTYNSIPAFPEDHRWLRLVRRNTRFLAYTSADGKTWQKAMDRINPKTKKDIYAGILFRSVPGKSRSLFYGSFDNVTLTSDVSPEPRHAIRKEDIPRLGQVTALVQASKSPATLYARTIGKGLLKSTDGGERWQPANGGLSGPDATAVRSVAVHPADNSVVLRGSGAVVSGKPKSSLFRSADGGKSWRPVSKEIDFDGQGPTAMFGEVISFCPGDPDLVAAAGETAGLWLSRDAGLTWELIGLKGERVTCLGFVPMTGGEKPILVVGTFADSEFETVGLAKPASAVTTPGAIYWVEFRSGKPKLQRSCEWEEFGVTNIGFGAHENFATFATTRGIFYTWQHGNMFSQRRYEMPSDVLFVALGYRQFMKEWRKDDWRLKSTTYAAPFSGKGFSPVYCVPERTTARWFLLSDKAEVNGRGTARILNGGVTCLLPDKEDEKTLYLCNRQGVFKSTDAGNSYRLVYRSQTDTF
ncbi:MAG: hypothetical protein HQ567_30215 [Candidatus Nealsonbacteria bacterium]|nr:hypothetical protein [Candidatus Nealsonbacteria bacterium]